MRAVFLPLVLDVIQASCIAFVIGVMINWCRESVIQYLPIKCVME